MNAYACQPDNHRPPILRHKRSKMLIDRTKKEIRFIWRLSVQLLSPSLTARSTMLKRSGMFGYLTFQTLPQPIPSVVCCMSTMTPGHALENTAS